MPGRERARRRFEGTGGNPELGEMVVSASPNSNFCAATNRLARPSPASAASSLSCPSAPLPYLLTFDKGLEDA
jgi:hypothetical protein